MKWLFKVRLFSLNIFGYTFSPGIFMTIVAFSVAYTMFSLGQWQLSRADYKENLQQKIAERQNLPATAFQYLPFEVEQRVYRPVTLSGQYDINHHFLLDNRIVDGVVGYEVFTPFTLVNSKIILVNRGFIALGASREKLPEISTPAGKLMLTGMMEKVPSKGLILAENLHQGKSWPAVVQYIDLQEIAGKLDIELSPMVVRLAENGAGGLKYHQPVVTLNSAKNMGYAFQWFAMMTAVLVLYIVVNTKKRKQENE